MKGSVAGTPIAPSPVRWTQDAGKVLHLVLFEAAGCLMALPSAEVLRLASSSLDLQESDIESGVTDLDEYFGLPASPGPVILWRRGHQSRALRVRRVLDVRPFPLRRLRPLPLGLRARVPATPFWAVAAEAERILLVLDPARLDSPVRPHHPDF
jgi:hypothetical protein